MDPHLHRTSNRTTTRRLQVTKICQMVVDTLKALKRRRGVKLEQIVSYIACNLANKDQAILRKIPVAIQRGVLFGAIKYNGEFFKLDSIMVMASRTMKQADSQANEPIIVESRKPQQRRKNVPSKRSRPKRRQKLAMKAK